jgi:hypothetical protein
VTGRRAAALVATFTLPTLLFLTVTAIIYQHWRIEAPPRLSPEAAGRRDGDPARRPGRGSDDADPPRAGPPAA